MCSAVIVGCGGSSGGGGNSGGGGLGGGGGNSPTTVTFTISGPAPTAVATQVGSGSFTAATLTSGQVTLSIPSGTTKFAFAYVCPATPPTNGDIATAQTFQGVVEASTADGTAFTGTCPKAASTVATAPLTGSIDASAVSGASTLQINAESVGNLMDAVVPGPTSTFSFAAPLGTDRVDVLVYGQGTPINLLAAKDLENQAVPGTANGGSTIVLGAADETVSEPVTVTGVPAGFVTPIGDALLISAENTGAFLTTQASTQYPALPTGFLQSGDYYAIVVNSVAESGDEGVGVTKTFTTAGPVSIAFPAPWTYAGPTPAPLPTFNVAYSGFSGSGSVYNELVLNWPLSGATDFCTG